MADSKRGKKLKIWLKLHGHKASDVDAVEVKNDEDVRQLARLLHGITIEEYQRAVS